MSLDLLRVIDEMRPPRVLVVGDIILDRYVMGDVNRISPEAPIQILRQNRAYNNPGGMASVACNLVRLGAEVVLAGVVGDDGAGKELAALLQDRGLDASGLVVEKGRPTTLKSRYVAASQHARQQILRVDHETDAALGTKTRARLAEHAHESLQSADVCVFSDYDKGVIESEFARDLIKAARDAGVPVLIDPKGSDFEKYAGATALTPNRSEASTAGGRRITSYEDADAVAETLIGTLDLECIYITLDRDGIYVKERGAPGSAIKTDPREVYDVTGAGDNVISVLSFALGAGTSSLSAAALANIAGGIAVEHFGVVTVGWDEIAARIALGSGGESKLLSTTMLEQLLDGARAAGRSIVFTNGCFDILHPGHVDLLRRARAEGDLLVVGLNSDASVRRLKGAGRPIHDISARATVLGGLASVDYIASFEEDTPEQIIERIRPDVLVKGSDWADKGVVGREFVESHGGKVVLLELVPGHSTTNIISKMRDD